MLVVQSINALARSMPEVRSPQHRGTDKNRKADHVCFSCLKKAGRKHRIDNCSRKRQCMESENGKQCPQSHHPILHKSNALKIGVAMAIETKEAILPVLSANIGNADGLFKCGNVLLDSGAQISLIRQELAETRFDGEECICHHNQGRRRGRNNENERVQSSVILHR